MSTVKSYAPHNIPTIEGFKTKFLFPLLNNRFTAYFTGNFFEKTLMTIDSAYNNPNGVLECKVTSVSLPNYQFDSQEIYLGGTVTNIPVGLTKGNLTLTILNQGVEYDVIYKWFNKIYNISARTYGYYDDVVANIYIVQYATNGDWVMEHHYYDCTPYNSQLGQLSYDAANSASTFDVILNYFSYETIYNPRIHINSARNEQSNTLYNGTRENKVSFVSMLEGSKGSMSTDSDRVVYNNT